MGLDIFKGAATGLGTDALWAAKGDLVKGAANDSANILSIGTTGQTLSVVDGTVAWTSIGTIMIAASDATAAEKAQALLSGGTVGDGTADNADITTAIATINAAGGGIVVLSGGTFTCAAVIVGLSKVTLIMSPGTILNFSAAAGGTHCFDAIGTFGAAKALASNAAQGDTHVHVAAGDQAIVAAGDLALVTSQAVWRSNASNQLQGELRWVLSVASGLVTFKGVLEDNYTTANTARIRKVNYIDRFKIIGNGAKILGTIGQNLYGTQFYATVGCEVSGIQFDTIEVNANDWWHCLDGSVHDCFFKNCNEGSTGYGVIFGYSSAHCRAYNNTGVNGRHMYDVGGGTSDPGGIPRHISFSHSFSNGGYSAAAFDTHLAGEDINFDDCHSVGDYQGFNFQAASGRISRSTSRQPTNVGFEFPANVNSAGGADSIVVSDCLVDGSLYYGMEVNGYGYRIVNSSAINCPAGFGVVVTIPCIIDGGLYANNNGAEIVVDGTGGTAMVIKNVTCRHGANSHYGVQIYDSGVTSAIVKDNYLDGYDDAAHSLYDSGTTTVKIGNLDDGVAL